MSHKLIALLTTWISVLGFCTMAHSAGNLAEQTPIEVGVQLGTKTGEMKFVPNNLVFETGKLYKLVITNPSNQKHYFTSLELAAKIYTRKVQVVYSSGTKAEIKGNIREVEVYPGGTLEWWFVPVATGVLKDLHCHIKDEDGQLHSQKGMTGTITIK